jgi:hypothetical protein
MKIYIVYITTDSSSSIGEFHDSTVDNAYLSDKLAKLRIQELKKENPDTVWFHSHYSILERTVEGV